MLLKNHTFTRLFVGVFLCLFSFSPVVFALTEENVPATTVSEDLIVSDTVPTDVSEATAMGLVGSTSTTVLASGDTSEPKRLDTNVDQLSGALGYSYPIVLPPGRNGMTPELSLSYNSQRMDAQSSFGLGWDISIPYITRVNKHGSDVLYTESYPTFSSSLSGELIQVTSTGGSTHPEYGTYAARSETGDFLQYTYNAGVWTVIDKGGMVTLFGSSASDRQDDVSSSSNIYKWMISEKRDTNNNYISYSYFKDAGQIYPDKITYTNNGSTVGIFQVDFLRTLRSDLLQSESMAFPVSPRYQISTIEIKSLGTWVKKYDLTYGSNTNGVQSLLVSIVESGKDISGVVTTLPAESFEYNQVTGHAFLLGSWAMPLDVSVGGSGLHTAFSGNGYTVSPSDVNGDGLVDLVQLWRSGTTETYNVYLNSGSGWTLASSWGVPIDAADGALHVTLSGNGYTATLADINGDGLPDLVQLWRNASIDIYHVYRNTGSGWVLDTSWTVPVDVDDGTLHVALNGNGYRVLLMEVNGDGLTDLVQLWRSGTTSVHTVYLNTGAGWTHAPSWTTPVDVADGVLPLAMQGAGYTAYPMEVNGDGLTDLVQMWRSGSTEIYYVYLNTGAGWAHAAAWSIPVDVADGTLHITLNGNGYTVTPLDINSDGLVDMIQSWRNATAEFQHVYINTGNGWALDTTWSMPVDHTDGSLHVNLNGNGYAGIPVDVNADGLLDLVQSWRSGSTEVQNVYFNGGPLSLLSKITTPTGGEKDISYVQVSLSGTANKTPQPIMVVQSTTVTDPVTGITGTDTYQYHGGTYWYSSPFDKKFAGFEMSVKTDPSGAVTKTYYHTGIGTDTARGQYADIAAKIGKVYRVEKYDGFGSLYSVTINKWDHVILGTSRDFVQLVRATELTYDGGSTHRDSSQEFKYDVTNGNLLQTKNWGEVAAYNDGSFSDLGADSSVETITYSVPASGSFVASAPATKTLVDHYGTAVARTRYYYDALSLGLVVRGNNTKEERLKSGVLYVNKQKTYDTTYGIVLSVKDENGNITNYTPDAYHLYPAVVINPLLHTESYVYSYALGKVLQKTDFNGFLSETTYDGLGRVLTERIPDYTGAYLPVLKKTYLYVDTLGAVSVYQTEYFDSLTTRDTYSYFDGLGRVIQKRIGTETLGVFSVYDFVYNSRGDLDRESLPYFSTGTARTAATTVSSLYSVYGYDAIGRKTSTITAIGTTSQQYSLWSSITTDPMGKVKVYHTDARGKLVKVDEHLGSSVYSTHYTWNLNGSLVGIIDALGSIRAFTYDSLGHRLTAEDLHASADTTYGTWLYTYDNVGNLTQSINPNGDTINYTYDSTSRPLTENWTGGAGVEITYTYDTCTFGVGKLCAVTMTNGASTAYQYDSNGNTSRESKTITGSSTVYVTLYEHDRQGNVVLVTYPDLAEVSYLYNTGGLIEKIQRRESGGVFTDVVSNFDYAPTGKAAVVTYGNGVVTTNTYDASHVYQLLSKVTTNTAMVDLQHTAYTYDASGNIIQIVDTSMTDGSKTVAYTYDDLYRLLSATATGVASGTTPYTHTYTYDAIGNIVTRSDVGGTYLYNGHVGASYANPHAATSINGGVVTYDHNGNQLTDSTNSNAWQYTWNYKNQPKQIIYGTAAVDYKYDFDGSRVSEFKGAGSTYYPNKYYTRIAWSGELTKNIYAGNTLVGTVTTVGSTVTPYYIHTDTILGSNVVSDTTGTQDQLLDYYPFGTIRLNQQATTHDVQQKYGGHLYDDGTELSYLGARYMDPTFGRFVSQDPSFLAFGDASLTEAMTKMKLEDILRDPQSLNSYAYARNNPISNMDPDGKWTQGQVEGAQYLYDNSAGWRAAMDHPVVAGAAVGVAGGLAAYGAAAAVTQISVGVNLANLDRLPMASRVDTMVNKGFDAIQKATGLAKGDAVNLVKSGGESLVDLRNGGNINTIANYGEKAIRITTTPNASKIISSGVVNASKIPGYISSGAMQSLPLISSVAKSATQFIGNIGK